MHLRPTPPGAVNHARLTSAGSLRGPPSAVIFDTQSVERYTTPLWAAGRAMEAKSGGGLRLMSRTGSSPWESRSVSRPQAVRLVNVDDLLRDGLRCQIEHDDAVRVQIGNEQESAIRSQPL